MGIIDDMRAIKNIQKLNEGAKVKLSISQITGGLINLADAEKNLSKEEYEEICKKLSELRTCKTKLEVDIDGYYELAIAIIKQFDEIAPYEKYSGGNETEFAFMMKYVREEDNKEYSGGNKD